MPNQTSFETTELRRMLKAFLEKEVIDPITHANVKIGNYKFGVYVFFDYDLEPIYVGQTNEKLRTRIRRHLTNQRTDAVAMNVLDPFEVFEVEVWPLPQYQESSSKDVRAKEELNALEYQIFQQQIEQSRFGAILNEKEPSAPQRLIAIPTSYRGSIVSERIIELRNHPDVRIARRALTLSRLAQVISERQVQSGLRKTLLTQANRLQWLAKSRFESMAEQYPDEIDEDD